MSRAHRPGRRRRDATQPHGDKELSLAKIGGPSGRRAHHLRGRREQHRKIQPHSRTAALSRRDLSSAYRALVKDDIHCDVDQSQPFQVLIGVEFTGFRGRDNEEAMLHGTQIGDDRARLFYRFRPKRAVREAIASRTRAPNTLTLADYVWEIAGGGNPAIGLHQIGWDTDNDAIGASNIGLQYLQSL
jgi:hypothetical protein